MNRYELKVLLVLIGRLWVNMFLFILKLLSVAFVETFNFHMYANIIIFYLKNIFINKLSDIFKYDDWQNVNLLIIFLY